MQSWMNRTPKTPLAAIGDDPKFQDKGVYKRIRNFGYTITKVRTITTLLLAWMVIGVVLSLFNATNEQSVIYNQLHAIPTAVLLATPQTQYWTMDWMMTPMHIMTSTGSTWASALVSRNLCVTDYGVCDPAWWQTDRACLEPALVPALVQDEQDYFLKSTRTKFGQLHPIFTCMAEKIGPVTLFMNNQHSYSIGSTHNIHVLVAGVFITLIIILLLMLLGTVGSESIDKPDVKSRRIALGIAILLYMIFIYAWCTCSAMQYNKNASTRRCWRGTRQLTSTSYSRSSCHCQTGPCCSTTLSSTSATTRAQSSKRMPARRDTLHQRGKQ